jgi:hypothetical protein
MSNLGIKVVKEKLIRKVRRIPAPGEVLVNLGDLVEANTILLKATVINPEISEVKVSAELGVDPNDIERYLIKKKGDEVKKDEVIAISNGFFGWFIKKSNSPLNGIIEIVNSKIGRVYIRGLPILVEVKAHIRGRVVEILPEKEVGVETRAALINGVFGIGGENYGELVIIASDPKAIITQELIKKTHEGKILVGKSTITIDALWKAAEIGVKGIIVGSIEQKDLTNFIGREIGVGITGMEDKLTLIITEGFGIIPMKKDAFNLLKSHEGKQASVDGTTQIRKKMLRPEIIIPLK